MTSCLEFRFLGINERLPRLSRAVARFQTENDLVENEKCLEERKPWDEYIADEPPHKLSSKARR